MMSIYNQLREIVANEQALLLITELRSDDFAENDPLRRSRVAPATYAKSIDPPSPGGPIVNIVDLADRRMAVADIDSVQSQANRLELALLAYIRRNPDFPYPLIELKWKDEGVERIISVLELPHRMASGHLFASNFYGGSNFDNDPYRMHGGQTRLEDDLTRVYQNNPIELLLGSWQSNRRAMARIARRMTSRIDAYAPLAIPTNDRGDTLPNIMLKANAQKTDPLIGATKDVELYSDPSWEKQGRSAAWTSRSPEHKTKETKKFGASDLGFGEVPGGSRERWFAAETIRQTTSISLVGLRQEHFPTNGKVDPKVDLAAQTAAAALGLLSYALLQQEGYFLRSGCSLVPTKREAFVVKSDACREMLPMSVTANDVAELDKLYRNSVHEVDELGLPFVHRSQPFVVDEDLQRLINDYAKNKPKVLGRDPTGESH